MSGLNRTVVGGRTVKYPWVVDAPRGIEVLLKKASVDPAFRRSFLSNPLAAAEAIGLELTDNERRVVRSTESEVLREMVKWAFVPRRHRRVFLGGKVAAMLALVISTTLLIPPFAWSGASMEQESVSARPQNQWMAELVMIQEALQKRCAENLGLPSTAEWLFGDPLGPYIDIPEPRIAWYLRFRYKSPGHEQPMAAAIAASGQPLSYSLVAFGPEEITSMKGLGPPIDTFDHAFFEPHPLTVLFPESGDEIGISALQTSPMIANASHHNTDSTVRWILDGELIAKSSDIHAVQLPSEMWPGEHWLILIDDRDNYTGVNFAVGSSAQ